MLPHTKHRFRKTPAAALSWNHRRGGCQRFWICKPERVALHQGFGKVPGEGEAFLLFFLPFYVSSPNTWVITYYREVSSTLHLIRIPLKALVGRAWEGGEDQSRSELCGWAVWRGRGGGPHSDWGSSLPVDTEKQTCMSESVSLCCPVYLMLCQS